MSTATPSHHRPPLNILRCQRQHARPALRPALLVVAATAALGLAACGGGGSSGGSDTIRVTQGDSFTYEITTTPVTPAASAVTSYLTRTLVADVNRQSAQTETTSSGTAARTLLFSAADTQSGSVQGSTACTRTAVPGQSLLTFPSGTLTEGQTWRYSLVENCVTTGGGSSNIVLTGTGKILAFEELTTPAGSFTKTVKYSVDETVTTPSSRSYTCWRDLQMRVLLRCDLTESGFSSGDPFQTQISQVLTGFNVAANSASLTSVKRFAGAWKLEFDGSDSGDCNLTIGTDGTLTSSACYSGNSGTNFTLSGNVDSAGSLTVTGSNGQTFPGMLDSPLSGSGVWVRNATLTGAWVAKHR